MDIERFDGRDDRSTKPMEQRIAEFHASAMGNPKIVLDNGDVVWGFQCWWGPLERTRARYGNLPETVVAVPEGNEHIDGWVPPAS